MNFFSRILSDFVGLIFPQVCPSCGINLYYNENILCSRCLLDLPLTAITDFEENPVAELFWGRIPVRYCTAYFFYMKDSKYQNIIHHLKYKGRKIIGQEMGRMFGAGMKEASFPPADIIVPVPLHRKKLRQRGFNQSELIAGGMAEELKIPMVSGLMERIRYAGSQTRRSRYERWENVEGIFRVRKPQALAGKHILLVDDVVTTGSTLEACATEILKIEGTSVSIAALAAAKRDA